jgi:hypothetical protein
MGNGGGLRTDVASAGGPYAEESEVSDELEEPMRILKLGGTRLYIEPDQAGSYLLHSSDGTVMAAPFTRNDAARFARDLLRWVQEADPQG